MRQKKVNKTSAWSTAIMSKLEVYSSDAGHILIGHGYIFYRADASMTQPTLIDLLGNNMPQGWYNLRITDEQALVILAENIQ